VTVSEGGLHKTSGGLMGIGMGGGKKRETEKTILVWKGSVERPHFLKKKEKQIS